MSADGSALTFPRLRSTCAKPAYSSITISSRRTIWCIRTDIPKRTDLGEIPVYNCGENREFLYGKQKGYCAGCKTHFEFRNLTVDHIISRNKGGTDHLENLQLLCGHCNSVKGARGMEYLMKYLDA